MVKQVLPSSHRFLLLFVGGLSLYWVTLPTKKNIRFLPEESYGPLPESPLACGPPPFGLPPLACGFPVGRKPIIRQNALI